MKMYEPHCNSVVDAARQLELESAGAGPGDGRALNFVARQEIARLSGVFLAFFWCPGRRADVTFAWRAGYKEAEVE